MLNLQTQHQILRQQTKISWYMVQISLDLKNRNKRYLLNGTIQVQTRIY